MVYPVALGAFASLSLYLVEGVADIQVLSEYSDIASELAHAFPVTIKSSFLALMAVGPFLDT